MARVTFGLVHMCNMTTRDQSFVKVDKVWMNVHMRCSTQRPDSTM